MFPTGVGAELVPRKDLFVQVDVKKIGFLFWCFSDVTVMQSNVWEQGPDLQ